MKTVSKALIGTVAAGAMAVSAATPAMARDRDRDGIDAGDVIAGAVVLGGIAILAGAIGNDRDDYRYRDRYRDRGDRWYGRGSPRAAVERCVNAAERDARRAGYRFADVTQIRDVDDTRYGWRVKGNLVVDGARGWGGYDRYDRRGYDRYDRRDYGRYDRSDRGSFNCRIDRGRVVDVDFNGIRGLR
ncbi:hypothetical protein LY632_06770 [Erythrobacter sp. SDW2]|uniref:hypothetical protein n=1 Tax=Erythrobacter sp. SDW2 TaxID=2907154 RepID=UPI001F240D21|nr:hypothetical protein [Erythrobacter sp. SDW2]UIP08090.1 hypothetical protein LY632_06770 [Erythrobacter sp. SDW2]